MIHLDTHVAVWLYARTDDELSPAVVRLVAAEDVVVSPIVEFEAQVLFEIGRIRVPGSELVDGLITSIGATRSETTLDRIIHSAQRLDWTRDPFDRLITADAIASNCSLLTRDATIRANCQLAVW